MTNTPSDALHAALREACETLAKEIERDYKGGVFEYLGAQDEIPVLTKVCERHVTPVVEALSSGLQRMECGHLQAEWVGEQHVCYEEHECQQGVGCYPAFCRGCEREQALVDAAYSACAEMVKGLHYPYPVLTAKGMQEHIAQRIAALTPESAARALREHDNALIEECANVLEGEYQAGTLRHELYKRVQKAIRSLSQSAQGEQK